MEGHTNQEMKQGPVYIYNGEANLRELKDISLNGASLFFNCSFAIDELRNLNLQGANVFFNGKLQVRWFPLTNDFAKYLTVGDEEESLSRRRCCPNFTTA